MCDITLVADDAAIFDLHRVTRQRQRYMSDS